MSDRCYFMSSCRTFLLASHGGATYAVKCVDRTAAGSPWPSLKETYREHETYATIPDIPDPWIVHLADNGLLATNTLLARSSLAVSLLPCPRPL